MKNLARLQSFLEAMEEFGKVVEVFLNASSLVAFIWGPLKFLLQTASTFVESFDILLDAYEQIGERIPLLEKYHLLFSRSSSMREALALMYADIIEFHQQAIRFFSGKVWVKLFRSMWKDFGTRFDGILGRLKRHSELIERQADLIHFQQHGDDMEKLNQQLAIHLRQHREDMAKLSAELESTIEAERSKKYIAVRDWIAGDITKLDHESFCEERMKYPKTGTWILKHEHIQNWKTGDPPASSVLWLNGIPGAGKTILASVIIEDCRKQSESVTSYFYCRFEHPEKITALAVFKGLLNQLLNQHRELLPFCYDKNLSSGETSLNSVGLAKQLLEMFCQSIPKQYIVIDGLDECEPTERKQVLDFFISTVDRCDAYDPGRLRVLFVSQDFPDIRRALITTDKVVAKILAMGLSDNEADIRAYIDIEAAKIKHRHELEDEQIDYIKELTFVRAQGMFLYAKLVMPNLFCQPSREQLWKETRSSRFPTGLNQAYERIMSRIEDNTPDPEWQIAQKLLGWMVCARRPLKWIEIQMAVSMNIRDETIEFDDRKLRVHIHDICGSLVQILPGNRVELVHHTAKIYLRSSQYKHIRVSTVECGLTALCLRYLTFECFADDVNELTLRKLTEQGYPVLQDYAVAKWSHHFQAMLKEGKDLTLGSEAETYRALDEVQEALEEFTERFENDISEVYNVDIAEQACGVFKQHDCYEPLLRIAGHISQHDAKGYVAKNDVSLVSLGKSLVRNRKLIESMSSGKLGGNLDVFYGEKRFKCPKITCFYFHEGFKDAKARDKHINRHDRPYQCSSPGCVYAESGFASNKELDKHVRIMHPEISDQAESFTLPKATPVKSNWPCEICGKRFTRNFHMKNHVLSHNGERPHPCPECGKAFTRLNDCKRHQKLHARR